MRYSVYRNFSLWGLASAIVFSSFAIASNKASAADSIHVATPYGITNFADQADRITRAVTSNIAYALTKQSSENACSPDLAQSLSSSSDGKKWRITLRDDLRFSDGRPVLAEDVARSMTNFLKEETQTHPTFTNISAIAPVDDPRNEVVSVELNQSDRSFLCLLSQIPIFDPLLADTFNDKHLKGNFVSGLGAFAAGSITEDGSITLKPSKFFWLASLPVPQAVIFKPFSNGASALSALRTGSADIILIPTINQLKLAESDKTLLILDSPLNKMPNSSALRKTHWGDQASEEGSELVPSKIIVRREMKLDSDALARFDLRGSFLP